MKTKLRNVRLSFPSLFTPEKFEDNSVPRYGCALLVRKDDPQIETIKKAIDVAGDLKFGKKWQDPKFRRSVKFHGFRDGDEKDYDGYEGCMYISANRAEKRGRPNVVDRDKTPLVESDGRPYGGCYVNAVVEFYGDDRYGKSICAGLIAVQFHRDGEAFAGGASYSDDDFEDESEMEEPDDLLG
jgi:hypothetical protein